MSKSEEKRAAIIAGQAARELADAAVRQSTGAETGAARAARGRRRYSPSPFSAPRRGRPPNP